MAEYSSTTEYPYPRTAKFINREKEMQQIEQVLNLIKRSGPPTVEGVIYFGIPGIGKSRILAQIASLCLEEKMFSATVDFRHPDVHSHLDYLFHLSEQLERRQNGSCFKDLLRDASISADPRQGAEQALPIFSRSVNQRLQGQPLVLLLDSCELCTSELFDWIGQQFLVHLMNARVSPIALFLASRGPQVAESNWPVEIIHVTREHHVSALEFKFAKQHIRAIDASKRCRGQEKDLYELSVGHPLSNEALVYFLETLNVDMNAFSQYREQLAQRLYDEVIKRYVLTAEKPIDPALFEIACIPRRFDPILLTTIASQYSSHWYSASLRDLQKPTVHLIHADTGRPAYRLESTLRKLMHAAVSILSPLRALGLNQQLEKFYEKQLVDDSAIGRPAAGSLLELLYHHTQIEILSNRPPQPSTAKLLQEKLRAYFHPEQRDDLVQLNLLRDLLSKDVEFHEIFGKGGIKQLTHIIDRFSETTQIERQLSHLSIRHTPPSAYHVSWYLDNQTLAPAQTIHSRVKFSIRQWRENLVGKGKVAFQSYLSTPAQNFIREGKKHAILLTTDTMDIPFELMHDGKQFLCLTRPIGRQVEMTASPKRFPPQPQAGWCALVIGNPSGDLTYAEQEAQEVADLLEKSGVQVERLIGRKQATLNAAVESLTLHRFHLIHYAGHGSFDERHPTLSGLLFDIGDPTMMISADELKRYLQGPAFIFFSACWAAAAEKETTQINFQGKFIENLAVAALEGGACGCLGPMWTIGDEVAKDFALVFYFHLLKGRSTGEAVMLARKRIRRRKPDTWASWVLFGNPFMHPLGTATMGKIKD